MTKKTFWEHIEVLRWLLIRIVIVVLGLAIALFCFKDFVFEHIILAPCNSDFLTYLILSKIGMPLQIDPIELININLSSQLMTHLKISLYLAVVLSFPYIITEFWLFVKPALYQQEKKPAIIATVAFFFQFTLGMVLAYYLIFPLTFNFLSTYQVSHRVVNQISLSSYIETFIGLLLAMGIVFEMPIVAYFFARIGLLRSAKLKQWRKVAFVLVLIAAAFITPSTDIFTMMIVAVPLWLLYEFSIIVVKRTEKTKSESV